MANEMRLIPDGKKVTLDELLPGTIFAFGDDSVAVKSEYRCANGLIEAFIIDSGEQFWGGAKTAKEQNALMVQPLAIEEVDAVAVVRCKDCKHRGNTSVCPKTFRFWDSYTDEDGFADDYYYDEDNSSDDGFCEKGERKGND